MTWIAILLAVCVLRDPARVEREALDLLEQGEFLPALATFEELTQPDYPAGWQAKGWVGMGGILHLFLNRSAEALQAFRRATSLDPKGPVGTDAYFRIGMILYQEERYAEAAEAFRSFLSSDTGSVNAPMAEFMLGQCARRVSLPPQPKTEPPPTAFALDDASVRVCVVPGADSVTLSCSGAWWCGPSRKVRRPVPTDTISVGREPDGLRVGSWRTSTDVLWFAPADTGRIRVGGYVVQGTLKVVAAQSGVRVIAILPLEDYVRGVVPSEMPASWPMAALEAQAICSRTYAVYQKLRRRDFDFDLMATTQSQVFGGGRHPRADSAVDLTRGRILLYQGSPALALFHACSGGHTEDMERVWGSGLPYLVAREDPHSPAMPWSLVLAEPDLVSRLTACGHGAGTWKGLEFFQRDPSGRYEKVKIRWAAGERVIRADRLRACLGPSQLKSTRLSVSKKGSVLTFSGTGYGHGVGMSQWGARTMAERGASAEEILAFYYPGACVGEMRQGD